ncbi:MAG: indolepyruvate oxidoreductase subunit beta [Deltaproteobacteria bacterium]|nr:indolepyruvate oxidoreductase subunit beta [Deltaproteobacteria bacterium]MBW2123533.1 indolepyruvate oxidoreductase subunit beta [Deltaproteobacteria bacterium]
MSGRALNFLIAGVGGQGIVMASDILSEVGARSGYDVKKSDILGLAVRGGSVVSHVRWAERVHAPVLEEGNADYLIGFEWLEVFRRISYVKAGGTIVVNDCRLDPVSVSSGQLPYPDRTEMLSQLERAAGKVYVIPGLETAIELGNSRTLNIVVLGALSKLLDIEAGVWKEVVKERVPARLVALNQKAFERGRSLTG